MIKNEDYKNTLTYCKMTLKFINKNKVFSRYIGYLENMFFGGVAQAGRANGSYPLCRWFKSTRRHILLITVY